MAIVVPLPRCDSLLDDVATRLGIDRPVGMPAHVTLLYPFVDAAQLVAGMAAKAQQALSHVEPFACKFSTFGRFTFPTPTALYLQPTPIEPFKAMIAALERAFGLRSYGGQHEQVIPHMTPVEGDDVDLWGRTESAVRRSLPVSETIRTFSIYRQTDSGWQEAFTLPLGTPGDEVAPYLKRLSPKPF